MSIKIASMNFGDCDTILHNTPNGMKNIAEVLGPNGEVYWTSTKELTGIPPLSIRSNGTMLLDYLISGNMSQTGTPTPTAPIQPQECGDLIKIKILEPLCGIDTHKDELNLATGICTRRIRKLVFDGTENWSKRSNSNYTFEYSPSSRIINGLCSHYAKYYGSQFDKIDGIYLSNTGAFILTDLRFTTLADFKSFLAAQYAAGTPVTVWYVLAEPATETITVPSGLSGTIEGYLIRGGTPTPTNPIYPTANGVKQQDGTYSVYESYKIPISSANTTTPVYLGEVETTRKIKKLVLTGGDDENWSSTTIGTNDYIYRMELSDLPESGVTPICTHYTGSTATRWVDIANYEVTTSIINSVAIRHSGLTGVSDWKSYLQQQYAAGTPVTVWYVLATETTGIVNEPLRKIGDYADTLSYEQAGAQIPTNRGNTVIDVETTLKPSQMYIKYK